MKKFFLVLILTLVLFTLHGFGPVKAANSHIWITKVSPVQGSKTATNGSKVEIEYQTDGISKLDVSKTELTKLFGSPLPLDVKERANGGTISYTLKDIGGTQSFKIIIRDQFGNEDTKQWNFEASDETNKQGQQAADGIFLSVILLLFGSIAAVLGVGVVVVIAIGTLMFVIFRKQKTR